MRDLTRSLGRLFPTSAPSDTGSTVDQVARAFGGESVQRADGTTILVEARQPIASTDHELRGDLTDLLSLAGAAVDDPGSVVFLDIETTALNAGAGTLVVVVGLGFYADDQFVVRQYVLHDPANELAFLGAIAGELNRFTSVVTFNGKRFDLPLLEGRFHLNRRPVPFPVRHLDLLHPARRIWRRRLRHCSLGALESRILGVIRESDLLGAEVPDRYFAFLRDGEALAFRPVLAHNRQDVLTLARLAGRVDRMLSGQRVPVVGGSDLLGLGRLHEAHGRSAQAVACYQESLAGATTIERAEALFRLAWLTRQAGDLEKAIELFAAVAGFSTRPAAFAAVELAKYYEHQARNYALALSYTRRALFLTDEASEAARNDLLRRIDRLERRLGQPVDSLGKRRSEGTT